MDRIDTLRILIADPDPLTREMLEGHLAAHDVETVTASDGEHALQLATEKEFDLVVAELHLPRLGGLELIDAVVRAVGETPVIVVAAFGSVEDAVNAIHAGATDFVSKPFTSEQLELAIERSLEKAALVRENRDLREALDDRLRLDNFVSTDARMQAVFKIVKAVAGARTTALITGESGTGKTLLARAIHRASDRKDGPFVEVNCGALPESLLESELFGHVRGAFTGAIKDRAGKFEAADGGTIFLDHPKVSRTRPLGGISPFSEK